MVIGLLVTAAVLLLALTVAVRLSRLDRLDLGLLQAFHLDSQGSVRTRPGRIDLLMRDLTALGGDTVLAIVGLGVVSAAIMAGRTDLAASFALSGFGGRMFGGGVKMILRRPRPEVLPAALRTFSSSFPSVHAIVSVVLYGWCGVVLAWLAPPYAFWPVLGFAGIIIVGIGLSRLYHAVHWPSDVLAGWLIGTIWLIACLMLVSPTILNVEF